MIIANFFDDILQPTSMSSSTATTMTPILPNNQNIPSTTKTLQTGDLNSSLNQLLENRRKLQLRYQSADLPKLPIAPEVKKEDTKPIVPPKPKSPFGQVMDSINSKSKEQSEDTKPKSPFGKVLDSVKAKPAQKPAEKKVEKGTEKVKESSFSPPTTIIEKPKDMKGDKQKKSYKKVEE